MSLDQAFILFCALGLGFFIVFSMTYSVIVKKRTLDYLHKERLEREQRLKKFKLIKNETTSRQQ